MDACLCYEMKRQVRAVGETSRGVAFRAHRRRQKFPLDAALRCWRRVGFRSDDDVEADALGAFDLLRASMDAPSVPLIVFEVQQPGLLNVPALTSNSVRRLQLHIDERISGDAS